MEIEKLAIVSTILNSEKNSNIFVDSDNIHKKLKLIDVKGSWLSILFQLMASGVNHAEPEMSFENITFVNFNYDRCLEHFFHHAIAARFGIEFIKAKHVSDRAKIIHPYGDLGQIGPFANGANSRFGYEPNKDLTEVARGIRTYAEQQNGDDGIIQDLRKEISEADTLVFLGFAFHDQNLNLLQPTEKIHANQIFGTSLGMSANDTNLAQSWIKSLVENENLAVQLEPDTCADFIRKYQKSILRK